MKRIILKFATLMIFVTAGFFFQGNESVNGAVTSCWQTAMNRAMTCDGNYSTTVGNHMVITTTCNNESFNNSQQQSTCSQQASNSCFATSPPSCWQDSYSACMATVYNACITTIKAYMIIGVLPILIVWELRETLEIALNNNKVFAMMHEQGHLTVGSFYSAEDSEAYSICLANSGVSRCRVVRH